MQKYQSHKIVEAGKIIGMTESMDGASFDMNIEGDLEPVRISKVEGDRIRGAARAAGLVVTDGYLMRYPDNYGAWVPEQSIMEDYDLAQPSSGKSKIDGYRELTADEINNMNAVKRHGKEIGELVEAMHSNESLDQRWVSEGATDLQKGFMALVRSIAKPDFF